MGILTLIGCILMLVGWIWLIVVAFKAGGAVWGIINIFFQPLTGLIFCIVKKTGWQQFLIMIVGAILWGSFGGLAYFSSFPGVK